jgi:O-antigen/teichoic acid export membrane protein
MSVRNSVVATVASRVYLAVISLVVLPLYIRQMGLEAYGLIALFFVLQVWFLLLDLGLVPTLARQAARHRAGAVSAADFRLLMRALEGLFAGLALAAGLLVFLAAETIARHWLQMDHLAPAEVAASLRMMALCMALRLLSQLYRGIVSGFERQVWLAGFNALFGTLRLVLVIPFMGWAGATPEHFFLFQLAAATLEALVLAIAAYRLLPPSTAGATPTDFS